MLPMARIVLVGAFSHWAFFLCQFCVLQLASYINIRYRSFIDSILRNIKEYETTENRETWGVPELRNLSSGTCAGIFKQFMIARNRAGIGLSYRPTCLRNWFLGIDSWTPEKFKNLGFELFSPAAAQTVRAANKIRWWIICFNNYFI